VVGPVLAPQDSLALPLCISRLYGTSVSEPDPRLEKEKFEFNKKLIERWDTPSMIGAFIFIGSLTIVLLLSFFEHAKISDAVQIFIIGVVMFVLIFRYFKELTVGAISGKTGPLFHQTINNFGGKSTSMDSFSDTHSNSRSERLVLPKGDPRLQES
jgi:hypothetical protein